MLSHPILIKNNCSWFSWWEPQNPGIDPSNLKKQWRILYLIAFFRQLFLMLRRNLLSMLCSRCKSVTTVESFVLAIVGFLSFLIIGETPGADIYGNKYDTTDLSSFLVDCQICGKKIAVSRYAPHLEKCLGVGGRASGRAKRTSSESLNVQNSPVINASSNLSSSVIQSPMTPKQSTYPIIMW